MAASPSQLVFFSYSTKDADVAHRLAQDLAALGLQMWVDKDRLMPGMFYPAEIGKALAHARAVVVCLTSSYFESMACRKELSIATERNDGVLVLPVKIRPVTVPAEDRYLLPPQIQYADLTFGPAAAADWTRTVAKLVDAVKAHVSATAASAPAVPTQLTTTTTPSPPLPQSSSGNVADWSVEDVSAWLARMNLAPLQAGVASAQITGSMLETVDSLPEDDVAASLAIQNKIHLLAFRKHLKALLQQPKQPASSAAMMPPIPIAVSAVAPGSRPREFVVNPSVNFGAVESVIAMTETNVVEMLRADKALVLEALDLRKPGKVYRPARVVRVQEKLFKIAFFDDREDSYWVDWKSPSLHPVGWCKLHDQPLTMASDFESWDRFMVNSNLTRMPATFFNIEQTLGPSLQANELVKNPFEQDMVLEAIDLLPTFELTCVAKVLLVRGPEICITFVGWSGKYDYWCRADSNKIFPPGYSASTDRELQAPKGESNQRFAWADFLQRTQAVPARPSFFKHVSGVAEIC